MGSLRDAAEPLQYNEDCRPLGLVTLAAVEEEVAEAGGHVEGELGNGVQLQVGHEALVVVGAAWPALARAHLPQAYTKVEDVCRAEVDDRRESVWEYLLFERNNHLRWLVESVRLVRAGPVPLPRHAVAKVCQDADHLVELVDVHQHVVCRHVTVREALVVQGLQRTGCATQDVDHVIVPVLPGYRLQVFECVATLFVAHHNVREAAVRADAQVFGEVRVLLQRFQQVRLLHDVRVVLR
mmetsp:Transcript_1358/g.4884  ORF Transcript_1358/g.4884 Transcript_1358/m.4884 type:complete len:239 (+) Transcript_1358:998-1714(+)